LLTEGVLKGPLGALGDRIGRKPLILAGPLLSTVTALLTPHVHNPYSLVGLRVLDGIGAAALWPAVFSLIGDHVPENRRATAMSLFNVAYILGIALGPSLGGNVNHWAHTALRMSDAHSKIASFYAAAILFGLTAIAGLIFVPTLRPTAHKDAGHGGEDALNLAGLKAMLARIPMTLLMTFMIFLGIGFIMLYIKTFAGERNGPFHMNERVFGNTLIVPALLIGALSVPMGTLGDRIGKARAVKIGLFLCMVAYWALLALPNEYTLVRFGTLIGLGFVLAFPAWMALVTEQSGSSQRGAVVGAVATAQGLGAITGSSLSAFLYPLGALTLGPIHLPPHGIPFLLCGVMLTASFVMALFTVHSPHPGQAESQSLA
jgi:DHA1 family multidrug resistance protein-like MFS transporter